MARRAYDEFFGQEHQRYQEGQDEGRKQRIRDSIGHLRDNRALILQQVRGVYSRLSPPQLRRYKDLERQMNQLDQELRRLVDVYWHLYVEVDARGAQADLLAELAPAPQNALRQRVQDAGDLLEQIRANAPEHERPALANLVAAMRNYQREMERLRQSLPPPPAAAPTGGAAKP